MPTPNSSQPESPHFGGLVEKLLSARRIPDTSTPDDAPSWFDANLRGTDSERAAIDIAIESGFRAVRPDFALLSGHQAALRLLVPALGWTGIAAFCASEERGAHPRFIHTALDRSPDSKGWTLSGSKRWATLAPQAATLLVIASVGRDGERNQLRLAVVPADRAGVSIRPMHDAPSPAPHPAIEHAEIELTGVEVADEEVLPGDAYLQAVKPFRTCEDVLIAAALLAFRLRTALDFEWPRDAVEELLGTLSGFYALGHGDLASSSAHLVFAGLLRTVGELDARHESYWETVDSDRREAWHRSRSGRGVALRAKELRRLAAWRAFGVDAPSELAPA